MEKSQPDGPFPFVILRSAYNTRQLLTLALRRSGFNVTPEEALAMLMISKFEARDVTSIAAGLGKDRTTVSRLLDSLESKGLIERMHPGEDKRVTETHFTDLGFQFEATMSADPDGFVGAMVEGLSPQDLAITVRTLKLVQENIAKMLTEE